MTPELQQAYRVGPRQDRSHRALPPVHELPFLHGKLHDGLPLFRERLPASSLRAGHTPVLGYCRTRHPHSPVGHRRQGGPPQPTGLSRGGPQDGIDAVGRMRRVPLCSKRAELRGPARARFPSVRCVHRPPDTAFAKSPDWRLQSWHRSGGQGCARAGRRHNRDGPPRLEKKWWLRPADDGRPHPPLQHARVSRVRAPDALSECPAPESAVGRIRGLPLRRSSGQSDGPDGPAPEIVVLPRRSRTGKARSCERGVLPPRHSQPS